jgi:outer membrane protein TolC
MRRSEAAAGKAMAEKARQEVRSWEIRTEKEVRQAWLDVRTATQNFETARSALSAAKSAYDVVAVRIEAGKAILVEQLDALSTLTRARTNVAKAVTDHEIAKARVLRAVGLTFESNGGTTK